MLVPAYFEMSRCGKAGVRAWKARMRVVKRVRRYGRQRSGSAGPQKVFPLAMRLCAGKAQDSLANIIRVSKQSRVSGFIRLI